MTSNAAARWIGVIILLFVAAGLTVIPEPCRYHVDEQYYTDSALQMRADGDWLAIRMADGSPGYEKPALSHWAVLAGFTVFGPGFFGARFFFLLAGAAFLAAAYVLALRLFGRRESAVAATLILASNHDIWSGALRSTPDIWLVLFTTTSFVGFTGLLIHPGREKSDSWLAWPAAGLAVATKGLLGLLVPAWSALFGWVRHRRNPDVRPLPFVPLAAIVGIALAAGWFVVVRSLHGEAALNQFFADQVGTRTGASLVRILENAGWYLLVLPRDFLPWSLMAIPVVIVAPDFLARFTSRHRESLLFVTGWYLLLFVVFSSANVTKTRYFLPATPLLAAMVGAFVLEALEDERVMNHYRRFRALFAIIPLAVGGAIAALGTAIDGRMIVAGALWAFGGITLWMAARRVAPIGRIAAVAAWLLLLLAGYDHFVRPVFSVTPANVFAERLAGIHAPHDEIVTFNVADRYLAQTRVLSKGEIWPRMAAGSRADGALKSTNGVDPASRFVLVREGFRDSLSERYDFEPCGFAYGRIHPADILAMVQRGRPAVEEGLRVNYFVGTRRPE